MIKPHRMASIALFSWALDGAFGRAHSLAALLALLFLAPMAEGAGIFLPVASADAPRVAAPSGMNRPVHHEVKPQMVRVAHAELARARDQAALSGAGSLHFNLSTVHLRGTIERTAPTLGGYSLSGRIDGPRGGFVTLAVHDEALAGFIWTPDGSYEILPRGGGLHIVQPAAAHQCEGAVADGDHSRLSSLPRRTDGVDDGLNTVVDVLVVWTHDREQQAGGEAQVRAEIDSHVAYANDAFERSGAFITLNLVGAERVDYSEVDVSTDLERLKGPSDGHMDGVHDRRDALGADLVHLSVAAPGITGGVAYFFDAFSSSRSSVIFTHEVGHNFGLLHDRYIENVLGYEHGMGHVALGTHCVHTIMAYPTRCHHAGLSSVFLGVPYFSSPLRHYRTGAALGISRFSQVRAVDGPADAVSLLNRNRHIVAAFRP